MPNSDEFLCFWNSLTHTHTYIHTHPCTHIHRVWLELGESSNLVHDYNLSGCLGPDAEKCLSKWHFNKTPANTQKVQAHMQAHTHTPHTTCRLIRVHISVLADMKWLAESIPVHKHTHKHKQKMASTVIIFITHGVSARHHFRWMSLSLSLSLSLSVSLSLSLSPPPPLADTG